VTFFPPATSGGFGSPSVGRVCGTDGPGGMSGLDGYVRLVVPEEDTRCGRHVIAAPADWAITGRPRRCMSYGSALTSASAPGPESLARQRSPPAVSTGRAAPASPQRDEQAAQIAENP